MPVDNDSGLPIAGSCVSVEKRSAIPDVIKKKTLQVVKDSDKPLPYPFPLPCNFRRDVEACLKTKRMTMETTSQFLSSVANAIFSYKR